MTKDWIKCDICGQDMDKTGLHFKPFPDGYGKRRHNIHLINRMLDKNFNLVADQEKQLEKDVQTILNLKVGPEFEEELRKALQ